MNITTGLVAMAALLATQAATAPISKTSRTKRRITKQADAVANANDINQAFSQALVNPSMGLVADNHFSSLLMSVIDSSGENGNIPVIQL
ncbi:hypothetical protein IW140_002734 [Coemansia sp. RSA 1813]|nr:hypothetical protein EV178_003614 [Coemansia sp. RSA 1646]KAJ1769088.1 hypothetical protein LPJ74_004322 [Coemansia sp. RSA 1843]KAJ2088403.1 hypothetical protein IW138_004279 [Coemansia sp. RSA 986]KAJ2213840.1 hypothetical protein EV179_003539 [Coemansia sp. RSA 487]KAJ2569846.1 hypothetical protein IW140_002734 [Coemansia sp. RSA 1813]